MGQADRSRTPPRQRAVAAGDAPKRHDAGQARPPAKVFISYRREDTRDVAEFLDRCLTERLGAGAVFRDVVAIAPGEPFPQVIERSIADSCCVIVLIGRGWLAAGDPAGTRRLDEPEDPVRREIELALQADIAIIPVLVDGVRMPARKDLPRSIAALADRNAFTVDWQQAVARLHARIEELDRQRELAQYDLTRGRPIVAASGPSSSRPLTFEIVTTAMQMSLARQGSGIALDAGDIGRTLARLSPLKPDPGGWQPFHFQDLVYVIDIVGVKTKRSTARVVARSLGLRSLDEVPGQLLLGRPVLAGLMIHESWNRPPTVGTGVVPVGKPGPMVMSTLGIILGMDRLKNEFRVLTSFPWWGDRGWATLSLAAAKKFVQVETLRAIEATPMPKPLTIPLGPVADPAAVPAKKSPSGPGTRRRAAPKA